MGSIGQGGNGLRQRLGRLRDPDLERLLEARPVVWRQPDVTATLACRDEPTLQQISQISDGSYYKADNADQLHSIYDNLDSQLVLKPQATEITSIFAGASLLILLIGGVSSLAWLGRVP